MLLQKRIHDWSNTLPPWQSDLLRRLAAGPLTDDDRAEVRAVMLAETGAKAPVRLELADLPVDEDEHGRVELRSVGSFHNINCLAENQTLQLQPGLNVVFGKNGTGKTGHGRLLRGVCRGAEREAVLPNVFEPSTTSQAQTAEIRITIDGAETTVDVDLAKQPERILSAISVFDASCARIFLTKPSIVDYVPRALMILKSLADEQDAIADGLRSDAAKVRSGLPLLPALGEETTAAAALATVGANSDMSAFEQLAELSETEVAELEQLETAAATIRADKAGELENAARTRAAHATAAAAAIRAASVHVEADALAKIAETRRQLDAVVEAERELVAKAFAGSRFPVAGGEPWLEMWAAIVRYVEAGGGTFPSFEPGALCPTCEQELTPEAATRLADAQQFVRSDLRQRAEGFDKGLGVLLAKLPDTQALKTTVTSELRGAPDEVVAAANAAVSSVAMLACRARALAAGEEVGELPAASDLAVLDECAASQTRAAEAQAVLRDTDKQYDVLRKLAELQSQRTLHEHLPALKQRIEMLKRIAALENAADKLGTQGISLHLRKLQEAEITERLRSAITDELEHMSPVARKVEVVGQASKGETKIQLRLSKGCKHKVDGVLSTGEQAAIGMAFFLAELTVSAGESAIVLDDPVSSLDHDHREYLALRLVHESRKRQVVIYTHDLTFLYFLQEAAEEEHVELHGQTLGRTLDEAGVVREGLPTKAMSASHRRKNLRHRLRFELTPLFKTADPAYERAADTWVSDLRSGYDQVVEEYLFAGTVRRFHQHVRIKQMHKVKWTPELARRIHKAWKEASPKSHFEAPELYPRPFTPEELGTMLDEFGAICELTAPKQEKDEPAKAPGEQTTLEDELVAQVASFPQAS